MSRIKERTFRYNQYSIKSFKLNLFIFFFCENSVIHVKACRNRFALQEKNHENRPNVNSESNLIVQI